MASIWYVFVGYEDLRYHLHLFVVVYFRLASSSWSEPYFRHLVKLCVTMEGGVDRPRVQCGAQQVVVQHHSRIGSSSSLVFHGADQTYELQVSTQILGLAYGN